MCIYIYTAELQKAIIKKDKIVETKIKEIDTEWSTNKPIQGNIKPDIAINVKKLTDKCGNREIAKFLYECNLNREQHDDDCIQWIPIQYYGTK